MTTEEMSPNQQKLQLNSKLSDRSKIKRARKKAQAEARAEYQRAYYQRRRYKLQRKRRLGKTTFTDEEFEALRAQRKKEDALLDSTPERQKWLKWRPSPPSILIGNRWVKPLEPRDLAQMIKEGKKKRKEEKKAAQERTEQLIAELRGETEPTPRACRTDRQREAAMARLLTQTLELALTSMLV
jgi:hypothetical protein